MKRTLPGRALTSRPVSALDGDESLAGRPREFIQSLERGLGIIRAFGPHAPEQTVSELAITTGLTRATARRFLITLIELGYVESDGRIFRLTPKVLELGYSFLSGLRFPDVALPHLERLVAEVDEGSEACVLDGDHIVYVARVPSSAVMTVSINVGARMPAHATSMGKVLLAFLPDPELDAYFAHAELRSFLPRTVTDPGELRAQLERVREQGYAVEREEFDEDFCCVAAPVTGERGELRGILGLSASTRAFDAEHDDLAAAALDVAIQAGPLAVVA